MEHPMIDEKIEIACKVFESIRQNWNNSGSFQALVNTVCSNLDIADNDEIKERLKKSSALWLNNKLDDPLDDDPEAEIQEEKPNKKAKKNHDHH
jgi:hypothetical protein